MREPDEDRSADEQRAGKGGLEAVTLYPLPDVRNGLLKKQLIFLQTLLDMSALVWLAENSPFGVQ